MPQLFLPLLARNPLAANDQIQKKGTIAVHYHRFDPVLTSGPDYSGKARQLNVTASVENIAVEEGAPAVPRIRDELSQWEVLALFFFTCLLFLVTVNLLSPNFLRLVDNFGDSSAYMSVAWAIRHWDFRGLAVKQFWGLPYTMAMVSSITGISDRASLLVVCGISSLVTVILAYQLWGGWVAALFLALNFDWIQRSFLGGAEPLFMALLLAGFVAVRRGRSMIGATLFSLATLVRPLGVLALIGIGTELLLLREFRKCAVAASIGSVIALLYVLPLSYYFGNPFLNITKYSHSDWQTGSPLALPFSAIIKGTSFREPWTNLSLTFGWIALVLAGAICIAANKRCRQYANKHRSEVIFFFIYVIFLFTYNSPAWARGSFPRFAIPVLPFAILGVLLWVPRSRLLLWSVSGISSTLAGASAIGIRNVMQIILQRV